MFFKSPTQLEASSFNPFNTKPIFRKKKKKKLEHLPFSVHHHFSCQNLPIDGVRELAEEYTTTKMATFFTILTNKTFLNLSYRPCPKPEQKDKVVVRLMNAKWKSTQKVF